MSSLLETFCEDRREQATRRPNRFYELWPIDGDNSGWSSYNKLFAPALNGQTFESILENRKKRGLSTHVADFFGSSVFLSDASYADSLTGLRLKHLVPARIPTIYLGNSKWREVTGNLYEKKAWKRLQASMGERNIPYFDLIVSAPRGGLLLEDYFYEKAPQLNSVMSARVHLVLIRRAYRLLSPHGGEMYIEVNNLFTDVEGMQSWFDQLNKSGIDYKYFPEIPKAFDPITEDNPNIGSGVLFIRKLPSSPDNLP
ncbi:MAG: hypothetical protein IPK68_03615 [Bdellovibrionales bacterium]|nr:hypothetical protein [Bdellovibrionales bacterium]